MPYDPNYPQEGALIDAAEFRTVFAYYEDRLNAAEARVAALEGRVAALEASPPGGVTLAQVQAEVAAGVATCARNPDTVSPPSVGASDPPTQSEVQTGFDFSANLHSALLRT